MTHPTITRAQAVQLARDAGFAMENSAAIQAAENLAQAIYKLGRNAGLEEAKSTIEQLVDALEEATGDDDDCGTTKTRSALTAGRAAVQAA